MRDRDDDLVRLTPGRLLALALTGVLLGLLALAAFTFPPDAPRLATLSFERLPESGVLNPVTAVLLNYRSYDTLLEVAVLLLAVVGIWAIAPRARVWVKISDSPLLGALTRVIMPLMVIVGGYLLWLGANAPGGAFQGGAVLGGLGILWMVAPLWLPDERFRMLTRGLLVIGLATFLGLGALLIFMEGGLLQYPAGFAKDWILAIEAMAMISIGMTLVMLFVGGAPERPES